MLQQNILKGDNLSKIWASTITHRASNYKFHKFVLDRALW